MTRLVFSEAHLTPIVEGFGEAGAHPDGFVEVRGGASGIAGLLPGESTTVKNVGIVGIEPKGTIITVDGPSKLACRECQPSIVVALRERRFNAEKVPLGCGIALGPASGNTRRKTGRADIRSRSI